MMSFQVFSTSLSPSLLCFTFLVLVISTQSSLSIPDNYEACSKRFSCGNITAKYPFWGGDRQVLCGHPHLRLDCEQDVTTMVISEVKYQVLDINNKAQALKIARQDYLDGIICPPKLLNTTINSELFDLSTGYEMITLLYGLLTPPQFFTCPTKEVNYINGFIDTGLIGPRPPFNVSVNIPVVKSLLSEAKGDLSVLKHALQQGFELIWKVGGFELCEKCIKSHGSCGFDIISMQTICDCPNGQVNLTTPCSTPISSPAPNPIHHPAPPGSSKPELGINMAIGISAGLVAILIMSAVHYRSRIKYCWKKQGRNDEDIEVIIRNYGFLAPKRYTYSDVKKMTNSFTDKVGQGGYGVVYRGKLPDGRVVAVKVLSKSEGNGEEFMNEVACISRTSHVNIVTLLGFCYERKKRALIYEFMPKGSLEKFIYDQGSSIASQLLEWKTLNQIVVGVARGLEYLHRGCNSRIVHFDIKPQNILLDEDFCPKIADFGLAKLCKKKESIISMLDARGTVGYIAPEVFCRNFGGVSHKSDVYGFGMMVLEIIGVRKNIASGVSKTRSEVYFPDWIYKNLEPGADLKVRGILTEEKEEKMARKMILVSLWCIQTNPSDRPSMSKVVEMLEGSLESLQVPPKPFLDSSPVVSFQQSSSTSASLS